MVWNRITEALGMAEGGALRGALDALLCGFGIGDRKATNQVAFTAAVIALSAKIAKADGVATRVEAKAFEQMFKPPPDELDNVRRLFDLATKDVAGYDSYARQIARLLDDEPQLKRDVFDGLFHIAAADGVLHADEEVYLRNVAGIFGIDERAYKRIRLMFVHDPDDAYTVLGLSPDVTDDALKKHYRALVREHHPDSLIARGVPGEFVDMANRKLAAITAAYGEIARERGLK